MKKKSSKTSKSNHHVLVSNYCNAATNVITDSCVEFGFTVAEALSLPIQIICTMIRDNYDREDSYEVRDMVFESIKAGLAELYAEDLLHEIR